MLNISPPSSVLLDCFWESPSQIYIPVRTRCLHKILPTISDDYLPLSWRRLKLPQPRFASSFQLSCNKKKIMENNTMMSIFRCFIYFFWLGGNNLARWLRKTTSPRTVEVMLNFSEAGANTPRRGELLIHYTVMRTSWCALELFYRAEQSTNLCRIAAGACKLCSTVNNWSQLAAHECHAENEGVGGRVMGWKFKCMVLVNGTAASW